MTSRSNVIAYISGIPDATALPGVRLGKVWKTRARAFVAAAPTPGDAHLLVLQTGMTDPSEAAPAVLSHAIAHWDALLGQEGTIRLATGLQLPGYPFDSVIAVHPDAHNFERQEHPEVHARSFQVFPVSRFEIPAAMTPREAVTLSSPRFIRFTDLKREPSPVFRARFQLQTHRSVGVDRALAMYSMIRPAIDGLTKDPSGWVELENFLGEVVRLTWAAGQYVVALATGQIAVAGADLDAWLDAYAKAGLGGEFTHAGGASKQAGAAARYTINRAVSLRLADGSLSDELSDWQLEQELGKLQVDGARFAILSIDSEHYIQCHINDDGSFDVEVRDGGRDSHLAVTSPVGRTDMIDLFRRYASGAEWRDGRTWRKLRLPS